MTEESAPPKLPLFSRVEDINNPSSNFIEIFGIDTKASVNATLNHLKNLQLLYHTDKCRQRGYTDEEVQKCEDIFKKITEIKKTLTKDQSYHFLKQLSSPPTYTLDLSILDSDKIPSDNKDFITALLVHPKILSLSLLVFEALKQKYPGIFNDVYNKSYYFNMIVDSIAVNVTLSFFNYNYDIDSLRQQIHEFIEKSEMVDDRTYKLHDIIDLQGFDRQKLGNDYCLALNIFYSFMSTFFRDKIKVPSNFFSKASSSFYTHKEKCINRSYSPKPAKGSKEVTTTRGDDFSKKNKHFTEFQKRLKTDLFLDYKNFKNKVHVTPSDNFFTTTEEQAPEEQAPEEPAYDNETDESLSLVPYVGIAGSKSRRRHRRHARKTRRGRGRKSKSKTNRHRRHSRVRKHKKNTYTRLR
jgi:hypothetical protein